MTSLTVAAAQIACQPGDIAANLALHLDAISDARRSGVALLVFPELSLTDYLSRPDTTRLARRLDDPEPLAIAQAAAEMVVSFGMILREGGNVFNAQVLVSGNKMHVHRKLNLPRYGNLCETDHYLAGNTLEIFETATGRISTLICADSWNPALVWLAAHQAPDMLLQPIASARGAVGAEFDNPAGWRINLRHSAMIYGLPTIMCNHCSTRGGLDFWGGSRILDAFGRELVELDHQPGMAVAEIDTSTARRARALLPTVRDANPALVRALMRAGGLA
ncbi:nitrilase-related carbon-nitrogen hydrolase [Paracoccus laeviglucosivorans]|uniref:Predicted amidohydrolase n=1 Tax=Paracoccus laeviglucosivorans TaxID=1197861 RepID=A0A521BJF0_9RHOB|nr:nitrilase-related carbon-nitrogen hydrolase [Paracoccus laeviglucosivorans]SMO47264.1 Predicted amidohydrolase [Paracoccus laeviglucosivorans]